MVSLEGQFNLHGTENVLKYDDVAPLSSQAYWAAT